MLSRIKELIAKLTKKPSTPKEKETKKMDFNFKLYTPAEQKHIENVKTTGYFPPGAGGYKSKKEEIMEGGALDCLGKPLRTLQDYEIGSYVSIAVDKRVIPLKSVVHINGMNDSEGRPILFYACDVGGAIKGKHIDICVKNEAESFKVTKKVDFITIVGKA